MKLTGETAFNLGNLLAMRVFDRISCVQVQMLLDNIEEVLSVNVFNLLST